MKKFIVSLFLLGWLPLYAAGSPLQETEEVAAANKMSEAGSVDTDRFNVPLQKEKKRQSPREKQKRVMNTEKTGIAIIAPGGYVPDSDLQRAIGVLKSRGYEVFNYVDPQKRHERFAANDEERSRQIMGSGNEPGCEDCDCFAGWLRDDAAFARS